MLSLWWTLFLFYIVRVCMLWSTTSLLNISSYLSQNAEEVSFAANGITAAGLKAFDGVLQSNFVLKTLDLSGNPIGDEGAKVCPGPLLWNLKILDIAKVNSIFSYGNIEIKFSQILYFQLFN